MDGDEDDLEADAYEIATGISRDEYERRFAAAVRYRLMDQRVEFDFDDREVPRQVAYNVLAPDGGAVEDVSLEGGTAARFVVVRFRLDQLPGRRLGWRIPVWPAALEPPEARAEFAHTYLDEEINSYLPTAMSAVADPDGVYWMPDYV
jgi:hypothetical protein